MESKIKTQYNINPSEKARQFLQMAGVPTLLLTPFNFDLDKLIQPWQLTDEKIVNKKQQIAWFNNLQYRFDEYTAVISSQEYYLQARQLALVIFWQHLGHALNETDNQILPHWHVPGSGFQNTLIDDYNNGKYRYPNLLVLDNIYSDMSANRCDKIIDILQTIGNRPRLIIYRGVNARQFCIDKLGVRPTCLIQIGATTLRKTIKI